MKETIALAICILALTGCGGEPSRPANEIVSKHADIDDDSASYIINVSCTHIGNQVFSVGRDFWIGCAIGDGFDSETFTTFTIQATRVPTPASASVNLVTN